MGSITDIKAKFSYGARPNLFEVTLAFPFGGDNELATFMCNKAQLPETRPITQIEIAYQGDKFQIAGNKDAVPADMTLSFYTDENFAIRNAFELWTETIQTENLGLRTVPELYKTDTIRINQLDHNKETIRTVQLFGAWCKQVNAIELDWSSTEIEMTDVVIAYDRWQVVA